MRVSSLLLQQPLPGLAPSMPDLAGIPAPHDEYAQIFGIPEWVFAEVERAEAIAQAARAARIAGDFERAGELDVQFDAIYDWLEAENILKGEKRDGTLV